MISIVVSAIVVFLSVWLIITLVGDVMRYVWDLVLILAISSLAWLAGFNYGWGGGEIVTLKFNPQCNEIWKSYAKKIGETNAK